MTVVGGGGGGAGGGGGGGGGGGAGVDFSSASSFFSCLFSFSSNCFTMEKDSQTLPPIISIIN